jgi:hypothetical protein
LRAAVADRPEPVRLFACLRTVPVSYRLRVLLGYARAGTTQELQRQVTALHRGGSSPGTPRLGATGACQTIA